MREETIVVNGLQINYKIVGEGPTILILHGWGSKNDRWVRVAELLPQHNFSVLMPDLPGFGKSETPSQPWGTEDYGHFIEQFAQKIGLQSFYLLGHSFGGAVAALYAAKFPSRVQKLILVASAVFRRKTAKQALLRTTSKIFKIFSFVPLYPLFRKVMYRFIIQKSDYPYTSGTMKETYKKVIGKDLSSYLPLIQAPTLIIWGDRDDVLPVSDAYLIQQKIKHSRLAIISGGDHDIEQHMPEILAEKTKEFIQ